LASSWRKRVINSERRGYNFIPKDFLMNYRNAKRLANGWIDCEIEHLHFGWIPFTCDPNDAGALFDVAALHATMDADPATAAYVPPTQEELDAAAAEAVRAERDYKLASEVDPIVSNPLRWADLTAEKQAEWVAYRRALLDITAQPGFPHSVVWPTKPE
jgi:hypothetical protein